MDSLIKKIKDEAVILLGIYVIFIIMFKIIFYKEDTFTVVRIISSMMVMFVIPGFLIFYYWHEKMDFLERLIFSICLNIALLGSIGYILGYVFGIKIIYQFLLIASINTLFGLVIIAKQIKKK